MGKQKRQQSLVASAVLFILVVGASLAWACTYRPTIDMQPPAGEAGSQAKAMGRGFFPPGSIVQIKWNSATGVVLGQTIINESNQFAVNVTIPDAAPDVYYVAAVVNGTVHATNSFEVLASSRPSVQNAGSTGDGQVSQSTGGGDAQPAGQTDNNQAGQTSGTTSGGTSEAESPATEGQPIPGSAISAAPATAPAPVAGPQEGRPTSSAPSAPASANPASVEVGGRAVFGGSLAPAVPQQSASGDLWGGFEGSGRGTSLVPGLTDPPGSSSNQPYGMLAATGALAMLAVLGGFGVAEARRRRSAVSGNF